MAGKSWTAGGQALTTGIGKRSITTDTTVSKKVTKKSVKNGAGPRKAS